MATWGAVRKGCMRETSPASEIRDGLALRRLAARAGRSRSSRGLSIMRRWPLPRILKGTPGSRCSVSWPWPSCCWAGDFAPAKRSWRQEVGGVRRGCRGDGQCLYWAVTPTSARAGARSRGWWRARCSTPRSCGEAARDRLPCAAMARSGRMQHAPLAAA